MFSIGSKCGFSNTVFASQWLNTKRSRALMTVMGMTLLNASRYIPETLSNC
ncbi:hypothetical protein JCM19239_3960 [Vibrio variabilis]|uniref:Uncharacterized protein n=1 Tax=Vibrio variabilis TaxID=990271 RepID=A0ABQ0J659_9VIBR|nr:hypothetical protein JCM19239_3960 [Vibrio variabilis]